MMMAWLGLLSVLLLPARLLALNVETSTVDASVEIKPTGEFISGANSSERIAVMGRKQCERVWKNNNTMRITFNFVREISVDRCIGNAPCVDRIMFFAIPIDDQPTEFSCDANNTNYCLAIDDTNLPDFKIENKTGTSFDVQIPFRNLVNESVVELGAINQVRPIQSSEDCYQEGDASINQQYFVRLFLKNMGVNADQYEYSDAVIEIDTLRPPGPAQIDSVTVTESNIFATWVQQDKRKIKDFIMYWSDRDFSGMQAAEIDASSAVKSKVIQLDNPNPEGKAYSGKVAISGVSAEDGARVFVAISARDTAENPSVPTFPGEDLDPDGSGFEVVRVTDFWEHYREAGGGETGGCNAPGPGGAPLTPAGLLVVLGAAGLVFRRRFRGVGARCAGVLLVGGACVGALVLTPSRAHAESPIYGIAEVRLGGYYPAIDEESGLSGTPFEDIFGSSRRVIFEYEMGFHLLQGFGSLGLSGTLGYTSFGGDVLMAQTPGTDAPRAAPEQTEIMMFPVGISAYYRFDILEKFWRIPLVPVGKVGINYTMWTTSAGNGETSSYHGDAGKGGTFGWHAAGALHLWLDWIEPESAAAFDNNWGVNNSYLFAEFSHRQIDDFGSATSFNLSDNLWLFGLAFEY